MGIFLLLFGLILFMVGAALLCEGISFGFVAILSAVISFVIAAPIYQEEKKVSDAKDHAEVLRLCDATGTGWYWRDNSQIVCPKDWVKKVK